MDQRGPSTNAAIRTAEADGAPLIRPTLSTAKRKQPLAFSGRHPPDRPP